MPQRFASKTLRSLPSDSATACVFASVGSAAADLGQVGEPLAGAGSPAILPFHIRVPEAALEDLRRRLAATRLPEVETLTHEQRLTGTSVTLTVPIERTIQ